MSRYGFGVSTRKFFSLDTAYFKKHVGIGTESPDSLLTVKDGGLYANKGVRFSGLPSGIPSGAKRLLISGDGTLYAADTTAGGGSGSGWSLTGNAGTNAATNFIGTTDGQPLMFRYNNQNAGSIGKSSGGTYLGIGAGENDNAEDEPNVGVGYYALYYNTTGSANSAVGASALASNTTGSANG